MIFLSYAREDGERAQKIFSLIQRPERPVFYDKDALIPGMDWRYEIEEKVRQCSLILILCSAKSISKEGYVQREIRLALDRAEMMPDGRVFIIPVRFDGVPLPAKLAKYHWIEIEDDDELYDVPFFVDIAWNRLTGREPVPESFGELGELDRILLREKVVILLQGKNLQGNEIYSYVKLPIWKLQELRTVMRRKGDFAPSEYGVVIESGKGVPDAELRERMRREHNLIDIPMPADRENAELAPTREVFAAVFAEAYRSVLGEDAEVPPVELALPIPEGSTVLREAVRRGLAAANRRLAE